MEAIWESFIKMAEVEGFFLKSELFAVIFGIAYVVLAAKENPWCWFWGILSCSLWAYASYFIFNLQIDAWLQVFYVFISFWGLYEWKFKSVDGKQTKLPIRTLSTNQHLIVISIGLFWSGLVGYFFDTYTQAVATYLDAFTTVFSVFATFMVIHKVLENWLYWIVIDIVYVYLYYSRGGYLFATLLVVYTVIAIIGYLNWRKSYVLANSHDYQSLT